tara:strand:- start:43 stop:417 length:375 start_codon:yes stop_codon:yes gene_type:complete
MIEIMLLSLLLLLIQLMLPGIIALAGGHVTTAYLVSARDDVPDTTVSVERAQRAVANLLETLPAFLVLGVLSLMQTADVLMFAQAWLLLWVVYLACYLAGIAYVRSVVWIAALGCLIGMALPLF